MGIRNMQNIYVPETAEIFAEVVKAFCFGGTFAHLFSLMALEPNTPGLLGHYRLAKRIT